MGSGLAKQSQITCNNQMHQYQVAVQNEENISLSLVHSFTIYLYEKLGVLHVNVVLSGQAVSSRFELILLKH